MFETLRRVGSRKFKECCFHAVPAMCGREETLADARHPVNLRSGRISVRVESETDTSCPADANNPIVSRLRDVLRQAAGAQFCFFLLFLLLYSSSPLFN